MFKDNSFATLGGICAIALGVIAALSSLLYVLLPAELQAGVPGATFLPALAKDSTMLMVVFWTQAIVGILGLAVVPAMSEKLSGAGRQAWLRWAGNLAVVGFAVSAIGYLLSIERLPRIAAAFVAGDASTKAALGAVWKASIDLYGVWGYGAVGFWVLIVSLLALRGNIFPKNLNYVGIITAIDYLLVPLGSILNVKVLYVPAAAIGVIVGLVWYVWAGLQLRKSG